MDQPRTDLNLPVGVIGAGSAGLITAHTLIEDGFTNVQVLTRDKSVGGIWAEERVYPELRLNNVHGEFRFAAMPMPAPPNASVTGGRLTGEDMKKYMEAFADSFLRDKIRYEIEVLNIQREEDSNLWVIDVHNYATGALEVLKYSRIVLCTGGCSTPKIPSEFDSSAAKQAAFRGPVIHSSQFNKHRGNIIDAVNRCLPERSGSVVVVGGGKSAQDISSYLARQGLNVTIVFETADAFLATPVPLPAFIRKSRFLSIISPHVDLNTRLERFLHQTWLGSKIVSGIWNFLSWSSYLSFSVPASSPLRHAHSMFWSIRVNDEGNGSSDGFYALVNAGKIKVVAPARVTGFKSYEQSVVLNSGEQLEADAVVLATGYASSWSPIFDEKTADDIGLSRQPPNPKAAYEWDYQTLSSPPPSHPDRDQWSSSIYRGLVPAKSINRRDFAVNGALFTTNNGYSYEVSAHWIASYFRGDKMRLPSSPEEAQAQAERYGAWLRKRHPDMLLWTNESYSSGLAFWTWPQAMDELLDDMYIPSLRSGGNWFTWPFKVIDPSEIGNLAAERKARRSA